jgi:hypothetical protein
LSRLSYRRAGEAKQRAAAAIQRDSETREVVKESIQLEGANAVTFENWARRNFPSLLVHDVDDPWIGADDETKARFSSREQLIARLDEPLEP